MSANPTSDGQDAARGLDADTGSNLSAADEHPSPVVTGEAPLHRLPESLNRPRDWIAAMVLVGVGLDVFLAVVWKWGLCAYNQAGVCAMVQHNPPWTMLSGIAAAPCVLLTWFWRHHQRQADISKAYADVRVAIEAQITDRYVKAVELLAHRKIAVRIGGIYALERIAKDSPKDYHTIYDVLAGFVRQRSPAPRNEPDWQPLQHPPVLAEDVRAALAVIARRERGDGPSLDLRYCNLAGWAVGLQSLKSVQLDHSDLRRCEFMGATLDRVSMNGAILDGSQFTFCELTNVRIDGAILSNVRFADCTWTTDGLVETPFWVNQRTVLLTTPGAALLLSGDASLTDLLEEQPDGAVTVAARIAINGERGEIKRNVPENIDAMIVRAKLTPPPPHRYGRPAGTRITGEAY